MNSRPAGVVGSIYYIQNIVMKTCDTREWLGHNVTFIDWPWTGTVTVLRQTDVLNKFFSHFLLLTRFRVSQKITENAWKDISRYHNAFAIKQRFINCAIHDNYSSVAGHFLYERDSFETCQRSISNVLWANRLFAMYSNVVVYTAAGVSPLIQLKYGAQTQHLSVFHLIQSLIVG